MRTRSKSSVEPEKIERNKRKEPASEVAKESTPKAKRGRGSKPHVNDREGEQTTPPAVQQESKQQGRTRKVQIVKSVEEEADVKPLMAHKLEERLDRESERGKEAREEPEEALSTGLEEGTVPAEMKPQRKTSSGVVAMEEEREATAGAGGSKPRSVGVAAKQEGVQGQHLQETKPKSRLVDLDRKVWVNRAPVLTLWVAVVAERQGYTFEEGVSFGKAVAGMFARSKGRRLGIYDDDETHDTKLSSPEKFQVFGLSLRGQRGKNGIRALDEHGMPIDPSSVHKYLERAFVKCNLDASKAALEMLADSFSPEEIGDVAYRLYEDFRPNIPEGVHGWGAKGVLDLRVVSSLVR